MSKILCIVGDFSEDYEVMVPYQALEIADYMTPKDSVLLYEVDKNGKETNEY